jgi:hypothetical protein
MPRFSISFADGTYETLDDLATRLDVSMSDVVREALSVYWLLSRELEAGNRLQIQRKSQVHELLIPSLETLAASKVHQGEARTTPVKESDSKVSRGATESFGVAGRHLGSAHPSSRESSGRSKSP